LVLLYHKAQTLWEFHENFVVGFFECYDVKSKNNLAGRLTKATIDYGKRASYSNSLMLVSA